MIENSGDTPQSTQLAASNQTYLEIRAGREPMPEPKGIVPAERSATGSGDGSPASAEYVLRDGIGTGGMGDVVSALHRPTNREVALKFALPREGLDEEERLRLLWEAQTVAGLEHPGIIPVHDIGFLEGGEAGGGQPRAFYAMRKMPQGRTWRRHSRSLSMPENIEILQRVCDAVAFAHSRNVIHRDIKPDNVMLGDYGEVFVLDWGLSASWGPAAERLDSARPLYFDDGGSIGSPSYAAPEQIRRDQSVIGVATDVYLLGATLFELLTESPPHGESGTGDDLSAVLHNARENRIVKGDVRDEHRGLLAIAQKAMASNPQDRYRDVKEFQAALRAWGTAHQGHELLRLGRVERDKAIEATKAKGSIPANVYALFDKAGWLYASARDFIPDLGEVEQAERCLGFDYTAYALAAGDLDVAKTRMPEPLPGTPDSPEDTAVREKLVGALHRRAGQKRRVRLLAWGLGATAALAAFVFWTMNRSARDNTLSHAENMFLSGAALRESGNPNHAYARFLEAEELFAKAGVRNHSVDLALWDVGIDNQFPVGTESSAQADVDIWTPVPAPARENLGAPLDGSISLPYPFDDSKGELLAVHPSSGKPKAIVSRMGDDLDDLYEIRLLDEDAGFIRCGVLHSFMLKPPGLRDHVVGATYKDNGEIIEVALQGRERLAFRSDRDKAARLPMVKKKRGRVSDRMLPPEALPGIPVSLTSSKDGHLIAAALADGRVAVVDARSWKTMRILYQGTGKSATRTDADMVADALLGPDPAAGMATPLAFTPENDAVAMADQSGWIEVWNSDGHLWWNTPSPPAPLLALDFSKSGELTVFTAEAAYTFWRSGRESGWTQTAAMPPPKGWLVLPRPYALAPDGDRILRMAAHPGLADAVLPWEDGRAALEMWDVANGKRLWSIDGIAASAIAWSGDGTEFAVYNDWDGTTTIRSAATGNVLETLPDRQAKTTAMAFSLNGGSLALTDDIHRFMLWDRKEKLVALAWPLADYRPSIYSDLPPHPAPLLFLTSGTLILSDVSGTMTGHLFDSSLLLNAKAPFVEAGGLNRLFKDGNDGSYAELDYSGFKGGVLTSVSLPYLK